jgi:hypothetical protein
MPKMMWPELSRERGASLVEVLVAFGLLGVAIAASMHLELQGRIMMDSIQVKNDVLSISEYLRTQISCAKTLDSYTNTSGVITCSGPITLRDESGSVLPTTIQKWNVSAECENTGLTIRIEKRAGSQIINHSQTGAPLSFTNSSINPLFSKKGKAALCAASFAAKPRVKIFDEPISSLPLGLMSSDCTTVLNTPADPAISWTISDPVDSQVRQGFAAASKFSDACNTWCRATPRFFVGGYMITCNDALGEVQCACFR